MSCLERVAGPRLVIKFEFLDSWWLENRVWNRFEAFARAEHLFLGYRARPHCRASAPGSLLTPRSFQHR